MNFKKFSFDIGWSFISQGVTLATGFFLSVIIGKLLGPSAFGLYMLTFTIYSIFWLVGSFGISSVIIKYVAEFKDNNDKLE